MADLAGSGCGSEGDSDPKRGLHSSLSDPTKTHKVPHSHKPLCQSSQEQLPVRGIASAYRQKCSGASTKSDVPRVLQSTVFSPKTQQQVEAHSGPQQIEPFPQGGEIQNGDTRNHQDLPPDRGVGHLNRFQRILLPYTNTGTVQEIAEISCPGSDIPIQSCAFRSVHSTLGVHSGSKRGETDGHTQGFKNPPVPRRLVGESHIPPGLSPTHQDFSPDVSGSRLAGKFREIRAGPQTSLRLHGLSVRPPVRSTRPTPERWQNLQQKILGLLSVPTCPVWVLMSLIGLLTATEKQVYLGRLHMRPIQWHLKNNWRVPESLEKVIPIPRSLHPHLQWWLEEKNVLTGQPLHPLKYALQILTDASKEGWGAHLNEHTARGTWSLPESKLHINYL